MNRVLIAMSGGVDSSVAAYILKSQGCDCIGTTMRLYDNEMLGEAQCGACCSLSDVEDARSAAFRIGIPHYVFNDTAAFESRVIRPFAESYEKGLTPNPCIDCNRFLKFDRLYRRALALGCDYLATGHYARIGRDGATGRYLLKKARDESKDQSYVLYFLTQDQLAHTLLPLGDLSGKSEVRALAEHQGLLNAKKHDSQDICFVPDGDYAAFLRRYRGRDYPQGDFVDRRGKVLGRHRGIVGYTVGQRRGLGVSAEKPLYVLEKSPSDNTVVLGGQEDLFFTELIADGLNLIACDKLSAPFSATARVRYHQKEQPVTVTQVDENTIRVRFEKPQRAAAPGQAVVLYDGNTVVGGATICHVLY